jgi:hypothetical protein
VYKSANEQTGDSSGGHCCLFNNAGVSSSSGEVPTTFERMGADAIAYR